MFKASMDLEWKKIIEKSVKLVWLKNVFFRISSATYSGFCTANMYFLHTSETISILKYQRLILEIYIFNLKCKNKKFMEPKLRFVLAPSPCRVNLDAFYSPDFTEKQSTTSTA